MSDFIPKPINPTGNLGNTNASLAIANKGQTASAAIRVVVSELNSKQVVLTNPNNQQSVAIPLTQFSNKNSLRVGQNFALVLQNQEQATNTQNRNQLSSYLLTPLNTASSTANSGLLSQLAGQSQQANITLNKSQANALLNAINQSASSSAPAQSSFTIQARVKNIIGNQVLLQIPAIGSIPSSEVKVTLPNQITTQIKPGQALNVTAELVNDKVKVLSLAISDKALGIKQDAINQLLASLNPATLNKIQLPNIYGKLLTQNLSLAGNQVEVSQGKNSEFNIDKRLLEKLAPSEAKLIKSLLVEKLHVTEKSLEKGLSAQLSNKQGVANLLVGQNQNTVQLSNKQASLLIAGINAKPQSVQQDQVDLSQQTLRRTLASAEALTQNSAPQNGSSNSKVSTYSPSSIIAAAKSLQKQADSFEKPISNLSSENVNNKQDTLSAAITREMRASNLLVQSLLQQINTLSSENKAGVIGRLSGTSGLNEIQNAISTLAKQTLPKTSEQTASFSNVINALNDTELWSSDLQKLLGSVKEKLPKLEAQPALNDANTIRQLLAAPISATPLNAITNTTQNGFLNALVTLLQVSLASRLQKQSNFHATKVQQAIPEILKQLIPTLSPAQGAKLSQEFNQFDAKHMLSAEVSKLLANHQQHKLKSADSSIQGQDSFYYSFPNLFYKQGKDIELSVKREQDQDSSNNNEQEKQKRWSLSMKFEIGKQGEMLAKTLLIENQIDLQIYTSNEGLKNQVLEYLPLLQKRLSSLGIELINKGCQLGKIPKTLDSAHFSVFETDA